jgi:uncharacterized protein (TIGR00369 family)
MAFTADDAAALLRDKFAPWVQALGLEIDMIGPDSVSLRMKFGAHLTRVGGTVCGQSLMALADTAIVLAISSALDGFRDMATVDQTTSFLRPIANADVVAKARVLKLGRSLVFGEVAIYAADSDELAANVTTTYALAPG